MLLELYSMGKSHEWNWGHLSGDPKMLSEREREVLHGPHVKEGVCPLSFHSKSIELLNLQLLANRTDLQPFIVHFLTHSDKRVWVTSSFQLSTAFQQISLVPYGYCDHGYFWTIYTQIREFTKKNFFWWPDHLDLHLMIIKFKIMDLIYIIKWIILSL